MLISVYIVSTVAAAVCMFFVIRAWLIKKSERSSKEPEGLPPVMESAETFVRRQDESRANCWNSLISLMEQEKIFIEPDISLESLAARLGTNRTYLSSAIKQYSGKSFTDYINSYRIAYAQELLKQGITLKNVEYSCGFTSSSTFYRQFQKITGMSPAAWLKANR